MSNSNIIIIPAELSDLDKISPLFDKYRQFYGKPSEPDACHKFLKERLTKQDTHLFTATDGHNIHGLVHLFPSFTIIGLKRYWILNDLFVKVESRNLGIGRMLLAKAKTFAMETGSKGLFLETGKENRNAQQLYKSEGFKVFENELFMEWTCP